MLRELDEALRALLLTEMTELTPGGTAVPEQVLVAPPNEDWTALVTDNAPGRTVNLFLADLRENRELRSTERVRRVQGGAMVGEPAPTRVACHYLITAWSPAATSHERALDEHEVLADALRVLVEAGVIVVGGVDLPTQILPPEGFPKLAELWGTMGPKRPWRPAVLLVVTISVQPRAVPAGPAVTTRTTDYRLLDGGSAVVERRTQIAGRVRDAAGAPVGRAWVQLEEPGDVPVQATRTNAAGQFDFLRVQPGTYRLRARSDLHPEVRSPQFSVPSADGRYDLAFP